MSYENFLRWIREIPGHPRAQAACEKVIEEEPQQLYNEGVHNETGILEDVPNSFKTQSMREGAVEKIPHVLRHIPDYFETPEMCNKAVEVDPWQLKYVPEDLIT